MMRIGLPIRMIRLVDHLELAERALEAAKQLQSAGVPARTLVDLLETLQMQAEDLVDRSRELREMIDDETPFLGEIVDTRKIGETK